MKICSIDELKEHDFIELDGSVTTAKIGEYMAPEKTGDTILTDYLLSNFDNKFNNDSYEIYTLNDKVYYIGEDGARWRNIYLGMNPNVTSDIRAKEDISYLNSDTNQMNKNNNIVSI